jgi:hypothetical protein
MTITKITKAKASYHTWTAAELNNGDIIGVEESLGRAANQLTIESLGGQTVLRFNVCEKIYGTQQGYNDWLQNAGFYTRPYLIDEVEKTKDDIIIETGATSFWDNEMLIRDIKIISKAPGLKILVN